MIQVTAGIILRDDEVLIAKRGGGGNLDGKWEFPGGKIKSDESPQACLRRELVEELDVTVEVGEFFGENVYEYRDKTVRLLGFFAKWVDGDIKPQVHREVEWAKISSLTDYDFLPADLPLVKKLINENQSSAPH